MLFQKLVIGLISANINVVRYLIGSYKCYFEIEVPSGREIPGPFERTGKPFGGLINDIKRRYPYYWDDIKMGLNMQSVSTVIS